MSRTQELADLISAQVIGLEAARLLTEGAAPVGQYAVLPVWWWGFALVGRRADSSGGRRTMPHRLNGPALVGVDDLPVTKSTDAFGQHREFTFEAGGVHPLSATEALRFGDDVRSAAVHTGHQHLPGLVEAGRVANWEMLLLAEKITRAAIVTRLKSLVGALVSIGQGSQFADGAGFDDETITQIAASMTFGDPGGTFGQVGRFVAKAVDADFVAVEPARWLSMEITSLVSRELARRFGDPRSGQMIRSAIAAGADTSAWSAGTVRRATNLNLSPVMKNRALIEGSGR